MNYSDPKLLYKIALTQIPGVGDVLARILLSSFDDEEEIFKSTRKTLSSIKGISTKLADQILDRNVLYRSEKELNFVIKNKIKVYFFKSDNYPARLSECIDAPILFYFKGDADLNASKIISIVGTRKSSDYGHLFCSYFLSEVSNIFPELIVVSGLAYGIDINAHRTALSHSLSTVGVLAHGLDHIYPSVHRKTAIDMLSNGGLLSEFCSETRPDKFNFVKRNRIIAGLSDATIVVESGKKGGSLITADIANSYNREVFAVPGRVFDKESLGCNMLIEQNKAVLLNSVQNFMKQMQWDGEISSNKIVLDKDTLPLMNEKEKSVFSLLERTNENSLHFNLIANQLAINSSELIAILIKMEMKGILINKPGNLYRLK